MHILSSIKHHVVTAAGAVTSGSEESGLGSTRSASRTAANDPRAPHYQRARPSLSVRTRDISWPVGSSSADSPRPDDYDFLDSNESHEANHGAIATCETREGSFPLSRRRAITLVKRGAAALVPRPPRSRRNGTTESLDSILLPASFSPSVRGANISSPLYAADDIPVRSAVSDAGGSIFGPRSSGGGASFNSPTTPTSAFSFVDIRSPLSSPSSHAHTMASRLRLSISPTTTNRPTSLESGASEDILLSRRQPKKPPANASHDDDELRGPPPRDDWDIVFDRIKEYRATHEAPVDTVGCEALTQEEKDPKLKRFRSLVSLMLSAQTKDEITADAVRSLSQRLPGGLTPKALSEAPIDLIHECVRKVGFWQRKSNYIKEAARTCLEQYAGDIPRTVPQLLSLPGVGPKMAYLAMHAAWQDNQGIGVDTHVLRISHRLAWVDDSAKSPEATRHALEAWMPKSLWREINPLLVGFGQTVCRAVSPKCADCPVSQYCPSRSSLQPKRRGASRSTAVVNRSRASTGAEEMSHGAIFSESAELDGVDVEDLASMVRGAEQAVRSRKSSGGRSRQGVVAKAEFPEIPNSPLTKRNRPPAPLPQPPATDDETALSGEEIPSQSGTRMRRGVGSRRLRNQLKMPVLDDGDDDYDSGGGGGAKHDESGDLADMRLEGEDEAEESPTGTTSQYFMRSRSNAASEEVRPEAKTDTVRSARAKATAEKLYSRRLSKSDMQWALGEEWDPDDSSSSLSDLEFDDAAA
ncbi:alpha,alpha-trehalase nth1 [Coemansia sp. RSA 2320]|nr:alpha,alpha-trehalase nth1 [Coemansia sp. RSA 2320]